MKEEQRVNQGYEIIQAIQVGNAEFVLGVNMSENAQFVTWECKGNDNYFWGHYFTDQLAATKDLCERAIQEVEFHQQRQENMKRHHQKVNKEQER